METFKNCIKTAALKLNKEEIQGKYGKFMAYIVEGDTMPIKDRLKSIGFQWVKLNLPYFKFILMLIL